MGPLSGLESPRDLTEFFSRDKLLCHGCRNEILQAGWLNNEIYLLMVLAVRRPRSRSQQVWFLLRAVLGLQVATFSVLTRPCLCSRASLVFLPLFIRPLVRLD